MKMSASSVFHKSKHKAQQVHYMAKDWPDDMKISREAFEEYAARIEQEDFEDDLRNLSASLHQLVGARRDSIKKLRASAEYLDSVWVRCRVSKSVGTSASVVGGSLTIAGGILTLTTAGLAAPLLIAGIATSSVGAATNIGTSVVERIINSKQVKEMGEALNRDKELTLKIEDQVSQLRRYRDSANLTQLLSMAEDLLGRDHLVIAILASVLSADASRIKEIHAKFISDDVHASLLAEERDLGVGVVATIEDVPPSSSSSTNNNITSDGETSEAAKAAAAAAAAAGAAGAASAAKRAAAKESLRYNPLSPDVFLETGKVVGQNGTRLTGQVIVGVSAAFLLWDAIDLGWTVTDLVRKKGSQAAKVLADKAEELEQALNHTMENYSVEMMRD